jgi:hypothetical protein
MFYLRVGKKGVGKKKVNAVVLIGFLVGEFRNVSLGCEPVRIPNQPAVVNTAGILYNTKNI